jgi:hypothetical protein
MFSLWYQNTYWGGDGLWNKDTSGTVRQARIHYKLTSQTDYNLRKSNRYIKKRLIRRLIIHALHWLRWGFCERALKWMIGAVLRQWADLLPYSCARYNTPCITKPNGNRNSKLTTARLPLHNRNTAVTLNMWNWMSSAGKSARTIRSLSTRPPTSPRRVDFAVRKADIRNRKSYWLDLGVNFCLLEKKIKL